mgnify:CR=1 FL=1
MTRKFILIMNNLYKVLQIGAEGKEIEYLFNFSIKKL